MWPRNLSAREITVDGKRASASEIVDSFIWNFVKTFDVQHDAIATGGRGI